MAKTLYQKLFDKHVIYESKQEQPLLYIDRHFIHEVTSPQAFSSLINKRLSVRRPQKTFATIDHNVSTTNRDINSYSKDAYNQIQELIKNCRKFNIKLYDLSHPHQGIIHVLGPEQGLTLPGMTVVCGDSHTATHGAFGALAFGIGSSEVEHVLATQTLRQNRAKSMRVTFTGSINPGISAKDMILFLIGQIGHAGATGYISEFCGSAIKKLSMEERMTLCNMAIEMGAKSGLVAPDETTFTYLNERTYSPKNHWWRQALTYWQTLKSDDDAVFDKEIIIDASEIAPQITWGTNPGQVIAIDQPIPDPIDMKNSIVRESAKKSLHYMALQPGMLLSQVSIDKVFIGSCTNSRIEDLRIAAASVKGRRVAQKVKAIVVPGSGAVKTQAEAEGLDKIFTEAGFEWRMPGCSMCLAMNDDRLEPGERCASTSNRNFEDRQGRGGRTHLVSPMMAAYAAIYGHFVDVRNLP